MMMMMMPCCLPPPSADGAIATDESDAVTVRATAADDVEDVAATRRAWGSPPDTNTHSSATRL